LHSPITDLKHPFALSTSNLLDIFAFIEEVSMPNEKSRKKKDGTNKSKKLQAMRQKERNARPRGTPSATGQGVGERLKDQTVQDRPGNMSRA
jgi:hypothetical protein